MERKVTITDVAKDANVSIATVSRVLNDPISVKEATRAAVKRSMDRLGYNYVTEEPPKQDAPAPIQQKNGNSRMILALFASRSNPIYLDFLAGIGDAAKFHRYDMIEYCARKADYSAAQILDLAERLNVCGIVVLGMLARNDTQEEVNKRIPVVSFTQFAADSTVPHITIDNYTAAYNAVKLLISSGKRRIALLNGSLEYLYARERERGYRDALTQAGVAIDEKLIVHQMTTNYELANVTTGQILLNNADIDAVFAVSDMQAIGAVKAILRSGRRIPEDVAVMGFDGTEISGMCTPALTTVKMPGYRMGYLAGEMITQLAEGKEVVHPQIVLDTEILIRETT